MAFGGMVSLGLLALPAIAESNFGNVTLNPGFDAAQGTLRGHTGGRNSLPQTISERDRSGNICLGYGSSTPDHIVVLNQDFDRLTFQVNSGNHDTTLIVRGPGGVWCGDDISSSNRGDRIEGQMSAGSYEVWVGTNNPGSRVNYTLTVSQ